MTQPWPANGEDVWALGPHVLARLVRSVGGAQLELCEDAVQDALLEAVERSRAGGTFDSPVGWLYAVARRRCIDRVRADRRRREREAREAMLAGSHESPRATAADDSLLLLQLCCDPTLPPAGQIALTLRAVCGLTTEQIAGLYQVPVATIAQRVTRAKRRLDQSGRTFTPSTGGLDRLPTVLNTIYLMLTESHHTTAGDPAQDHTLAGEALHLARQLREVLPGTPRSLAYWR